MGLAAVAKSLAGRLGLDVRRLGPRNRFEAMGGTLRMLAARGYRPRVVIDGGANLGTWTQLAQESFPDATFHLVEPQAACQARLAERTGPKYHLHRWALTRPGVSSILLASRGGGGIGRGAFVIVDRAAVPAGTDVETCPAATLDELFATRVESGDRALLKLDMEGHELEALRGGVALLPRVEVMVCEVSFFDVWSAGHVLFHDVFDFVRARGFTLYDFAALSGRRRDGRLVFGDAVFVRQGSPLLEDVSWD
jgi:FkbM family methyltransferase